MKKKRMDILCTLFLCGITAASCWEMYTYENGFIRIINGSHVISLLLPVLAFFAAASLVKNTVFLLPLSIAVGIFLRFQNDAGFIFLPLVLIPCLFFGALGKDKKDRIVFYAASLLNAAALIYCFAKQGNGFFGMGKENIPTPAQLTSAGIGAKCLLTLFVPLFACCLYKSFSFSAPEKSSRKKSKAKAAEQKTKLSERYNTFYLLVTANALLTALYTVLFANKALAASMTVAWCAVMLLLYFGEDPTVRSILAKITKERSSSDDV